MATAGTWTLTLGQPLRVVGDSVRTFATILNAYKECSDEIQAIVDDMVDIIEDSSASDEEQGHAVDVIVEALFPSLVADVLERGKARLRSEEGLKARADLDREEETFAERLRLAMAAKNITQEELAVRIGVGQSAISMMLNRQCRPQRKTVIRLANALDVPPEELWPFS